MHFYKRWKHFSTIFQRVIHATVTYARRTLVVDTSELRFLYALDLKLLMTTGLVTPAQTIYISAMYAFFMHSATEYYVMSINSNLAENLDYSIYFIVCCVWHFTHKWCHSEFDFKYFHFYVKTFDNNTVFYC